jgi:hypothetical protein
LLSLTLSKPFQKLPHSLDRSPYSLILSLFRVPPLSSVSVPSQLFFCTSLSPSSSSFPSPSLSLCLSFLIFVSASVLSRSLRLPMFLSLVLCLPLTSWSAWARAWLIRLSTLPVYSCLPPLSLTMPLCPAQTGPYGLRRGCLCPRLIPSVLSAPGRAPVSVSVSVSVSVFCLVSVPDASHPSHHLSLSPSLRPAQTSLQGLLGGDLCLHK